MTAINALGVAAAASAGRAVVRIGKTHTEPLNLYVAGVAGSGERKGAALRAMLAPLEAREKELQAETREEIARARRELAVQQQRLKHLTELAAKDKDPGNRELYSNEAKELEANQVQVPPVPRLLVGNSTPEKLEVLLAEQGGTICMAAEEAGGTFEIAAGRYAKDGGAQIDTLLQAYDGGRISTERITRIGAQVDRPALSIVLTPQPIILSSFRDHPEFIHRGLIARFLFAMPQSLVGTRLYKNDPASPQARLPFENAIRGLLSLPKRNDDTVPEIRIEGEALEIWRGFHDEIELSQAQFQRLEPIREWASKHAARVARIAGIFHLAENPGKGPWNTPIASETMLLAVRLGWALVDHALAAHAMMGADEKVEAARYVLSWIRKQDKSSFTQKEAFDGTRGRFRRVQNLEPVLAYLEENGYVRAVLPRRDPRPGRRPSPFFEVNPASFSHNSPNPQNSGGYRPIVDLADSANCADPSGKLAEDCPPGVAEANLEVATEGHEA